MCYSKYSEDVDTDYFNILKSLQDKIAEGAHNITCSKCILSKLLYILYTTEHPDTHIQSKCTSLVLLLLSKTDEELLSQVELVSIFCNEVAIWLLHTYNIREQNCQTSASLLSNCETIFNNVDNTREVTQAFDDMFFD